MKELLLKDGTSVEMSDVEYDRFYKRLMSHWNFRRFQRDNGDILLMDERCPIMLIKMGNEDQSKMFKSFEDHVKTVTDNIKQEPVVVEQQEEKKESLTEKNDRLLKEMIEKSNCEHPVENAVLYTQSTKTGQKYFYVCNNCGKRERFIKKDTLLERGIDIETAMSWIES